MGGNRADGVGVAAGAADDAIRFTPLDGGTGLRVVDAIDRRELSLSTPTVVLPEPVDPEGLDVPVDAAVRVTTSALTLPHRESVFVRDAAGEPVMHTAETARSCPVGRYLVQITSQVKLYLAVEAPVRVTPTTDATTIAFDGPTDVVVGARSPHRRPSGTITTTDDLDDVRTAVSALSSALKTTSPERSYPTLRGHPPRLELGEEPSRPDHLVAPDTGVSIEVRRSLEDLLVAAPLAFYLGAELAWGDRRLVTDEGYVHALDGAHDFETGVERVLKQTFLLDCLTRTEGRYHVELDERETFEARTDGRLDFTRLYDQSLRQRLERYLDVPYHLVADLVPAWSASTYVQPAPRSITYLPYLLDTLSTVRTTGPRRLVDRQRGQRAAGNAVGGTRSAQAASRPNDAGPHLVLPESDGAVTRSWVGEGVPLGASKALAAGFEHRLARAPRTGDIRIGVVCNEPDMRDEREAVSDVYRARPDDPFEVEVRTELSTDELRGALEREADFFHFIGHVDRRGFRCTDGWLDAEDVGSFGADVFFLNSCRSYEQGEALVRGGAIAGIVTVTDLLNHHAAAIGRTLGVFLHYGFPLYAALDVVRETHTFGRAYALLGDAHAVLFQSTTLFPEYLELRSRVTDVATVVHHTCPTHRAGLGTEICPPYEPGDRHHLFGGELATVELSADELAALLAQPTPLRDGSDLRFSVRPDVDPT